MSASCRGHGVPRGKDDGTNDGPTAGDSLSFVVPEVDRMTYEISHNIFQLRLGSIGVIAPV